MAEGDAEHMVALLDSDGDGRLSFQEFQRYVVLLPSERGPLPPGSRCGVG